jgi:hypothetical protein
VLENVFCASGYKNKTIDVENSCSDGNKYVTLKGCELICKPLKTQPGYIVTDSSKLTNCTDVDCSKSEVNGVSCAPDYRQKDNQITVKEVCSVNNIYVTLDGCEPCAVKNCGDCTDKTNGYKCNNCDKGYKWKTDKEEICTPKFTCERTACKFCPAPANRLEHNECLSCKDGAFLDHKDCVQCPYGCNKCANAIDHTFDQGICPAIEVQTLTMKQEVTESSCKCSDEHEEIEACLENLEDVLQTSMALMCRFDEANVTVTAECKEHRTRVVRRVLNTKKIEVTYTFTATPGKIEAAQKVIESKLPLFQTKMNKHINNDKLQVENVDDSLKVSEVTKTCVSGYFLDKTELCQQCLPNCSSCKDFNTCDECSEGYKLISNQCIADDDEKPNNSSSLSTLFTLISTIITIFILD